MAVKQSLLSPCEDFRSLSSEVWKAAGGTLEATKISSYK